MGQHLAKEQEAEEKLKLAKSSSGGGGRGSVIEIYIEVRTLGF